MRVFEKVFRRAGAPLRVVAHRLTGGRYRVEVGDVAYEISAVRTPDGGMRLVVDEEGLDAYCALAGGSVQVRVRGRTWNLEYDHAGPAEPRHSDGIVEAPMTGTVTTVLVQPGQSVTAGQRVVLLTAMKMEHSLEAGTSGIVTEVNVDDGQTVEQGTVLIRIEDAQALPGPRTGTADPARA